MREEVVSLVLVEIIGIFYSFDDNSECSNSHNDITRRAVVYST
jgi:hypothetical protein